MVGIEIENSDESLLNDIINRKHRRRESLENVVITSNVLVCVRVRPVHSEDKENDTECALIRDKHLLETRDNLNSRKLWAFDCVFPSNTTNMDVYNSTAQLILTRALEGFNATILACKYLR